MEEEIISEVSKLHTKDRYELSAQLASEAKLRNADMTKEWAKLLAEKLWVGS